MVLVRVVGVTDKTLVVLAPAVNGKTIWPNKDSEVSIILAYEQQDCEIPCVVADRKLKPLPLLYLRFHRDIPFAAVAQARRKKVIAISSGKGGTGKTFFAVNLAWTLSAAGNRVLLVDLDLGTANIATALGINPSDNLAEIIHGTKQLKQIVYPLGERLGIVPGVAKDKDHADLSPWQFQRLLNSIGEAEAEWDYILLDTGAGLSLNTTSFLYCSDYIVIVLNDIPTAVIDGYGLLKAISAQFWMPPAGLVVNRAITKREADECGTRFLGTARDFLSLPLTYLGCIHEDNSVLRSFKSCRPAVAMYPESQACTDLKLIGEKLLPQLGEESNRKLSL